MDSLALLCNLHADGPESLRRLRRAGVADLRSLFALGVEGVEPLLGRGRSAALRFLKEARLLEQRQLLSDAEDATTANQRPGGSGHMPLRERWPSAGTAAAPQSWSAGGAPHSGLSPVGDLAAEDAASGSGTAYSAAPRGNADRIAPAAGAAFPAARPDWVARQDERLGLAGAGELSALDEGLGDYVMAPTPPGRESGAGGGSGEPRHSVLSALLAAWSRGNGPEDAEALRPGQPRGFPTGGAPAVRPTEGLARPVSAGAAPSVPVSADPPASFPGAPATPLRAAKEPAPGESWLGGSAGQAAANHAQTVPGWPTAAAAAEAGSAGVARSSLGSPWVSGGASPSPVAAPGPGSRAAGEGQTIDLDAFLNSRAESGAGPRAASAPLPQAPRGAPLAWLINEQIDPAALGALERQGLTTLEQVLAGDPRDLSRQAGLSYTLVLRLQYLARRTLNERGA